MPPLSLRAGRLILGRRGRIFVEERGKFVAHESEQLGSVFRTATSSRGAPENGPPSTETLYS